MSNFGILHINDFIDGGQIDVYNMLGRKKFVQVDVYYRESRVFLLKSRVTSLTRKHKNDFQFTPTYLLIITWIDVHEYSLNNKVSIEERL